MKVTWQERAGREAWMLRRSIPSARRVGKKGRRTNARREWSVKQADKRDSVTAPEGL